MRATQTIDWKPFSNKHKWYIANALQCRMSVAEGAIRSGKTIDNCIIAAAYLERCADKIHLASGSTLANAKMNIGDCNGYGLEHLFRGRCRWGKYKGNEALILQTQTGEKVVIFVGGGLSNSYKKILGNSYGLWIATEINEHYDSEDSRESFIKVAMGRQVASKEPIILWDLNPCNPRHPIYSDYIDAYKEIADDIGGYNYEHFTMNDNLSISDAARAEIAARYDRESVWYQRDILGRRCVAEGLIYRQFADNPRKYTLSTNAAMLRDIIIVTIGVDFGGNGSATAFVCTGYTRGLQNVIVLKSQRLPEELNPEELNETFASFFEMCYNKFGKPMEIYADSAEQILIRGLKTMCARRGFRANVRNALKKPINDRIRLVNKLMAQGRFFVAVGAKTVTDALCEAVWDIKHPDERLDTGETDVDSLDSLEYSIEPFMTDLSR